MSQARYISERCERWHSSAHDSEKIAIGSGLDWFLSLIVKSNDDEKRVFVVSSYARSPYLAAAADCGAGDRVGTGRGRMKA